MNDQVFTAHIVKTHLLRSHQFIHPNPLENAGEILFFSDSFNFAEKISKWSLDLKQQDTHAVFQRSFV
jgi:hypothetical protein